MRPVIGFFTVLVVLLVVWEALKFIGGERWKSDSFLGTGFAIDWMPPFHFPFATDVKLPHTWVIAMAFCDTDANGMTTLQRLLGAALFTLRNAAIGFALGSLLGLGLAILLVHVRLLERALVPIIVASQTIPIIAIAPLIVVGLKAGWFGVAIVVDLPHVLPGHDRGVARPARRGPARVRADALLCGVPRLDPAQAAPAGVAAVPVHGVPDRRHRPRSSGRSSASCRRGIQDGLAAPDPHRRCSTTRSTPAVLWADHRHLVAARDRRASCWSSSPSAWALRN